MVLRKEKTYSVKEFMAGKHKEDDRILEKKILKLMGTAAPLVIIPTLPLRALAAGSKTASIIHALDPLISFIKDLSYPIAGVMIAGGCLFIMMGGSLRDKGVDMIKNAAIGYLLVQLSPLFLKILVELGTHII
jgi:hypothetical protein